MNNTKIRIRYSRVNEDRAPKNTLVTFKENDCVYFGISRCRINQDTFSKKFGRQLAHKRATLALEEFTDTDESIAMHHSGLRGVVLVSQIPQLIKYFNMIDETMLSRCNQPQRNTNA